ncbi:MAG: hypothetical protein B6I20_01005 [Bacteroidetes bacterium 4572_117]|nr:MAG: hypothetical protein B6I20_01005 [Bacteroidetes bacterium 4572_117]
MDALQQILENSKLTDESIKDSLLHPVLKTTDYKPREVFEELKEISDTFFTTRRTARMIGLAGLRGTGKTTLLWQTADYIYKNYTQNIYLFHIGNLQKYDIGITKIHEIIEEELANGRLSSYKKEIVLLFDEVHEDKNWARDLKVLYDLFPAAFVIATGSSALLLQSTADLVTRMYIQHVFPLSFTEFLTISNPKIVQEFHRKDELKNVLFAAENANDLFRQLENKRKLFTDYFSQTNKLEDEITTYILYKNITRFAFIESKSQINKLSNDLIRRVIYEDIPKMAENVNIHFSEKILQRVAASDEINLQTLSQSIGISQKEINENLDILVKAELLNVLYPFGGIDTKINKAHKYFFMSPSLRRVLLSPLVSSKHDNIIFAKLLEDIVVLYLSRIFRDSNILSFASAKGQKNPDLIIETIDKPILVEIGVNKNTTKQISKSKIKYKYGIIINSKMDKIELHNDIVIIPLKYFLLL